MKRHDINGAASVRVVGWVVWISAGGSLLFSRRHEDFIWGIRYCNFWARVCLLRQKGDRPDGRPMPKVMG